MRGIINPAVQHPGQPLKTDASRAALPILQSLALALSAHVAQWSAEGFGFVNEWGDQLAPWTLRRAIRTAREKAPGLPPDSAKTTLDTYAHLWPDSDESTRTAIDAVMQERAVKQECDSAAE